MKIQKYPNLHVHTPVPQDWRMGIWGRGVSNAEIFNAMYEAKLEIPRRWKGPNQKAILGGYGYF